METSVLTAEVDRASEPVRDVEVVERSLAAEKVVQAERCATNLGAVAIVCVGCPMLELCRFKNEAAQAAQEQQAAIESTDELSFIEDTAMQIQPLEIIESEMAPTGAKEVGVTAQSQLEKDRAPQKPSYLERLLDDSVEVVLADSLMDAGEAPTRSNTPEKQSEPLPIKETAGDIDSDGTTVISAPESLPVDNEKVLVEGATAAVASGLAAEVTADEPERSNVETPRLKDEKAPEIIIAKGEEVLVGSSDSKVPVVEVAPAKKAIVDIVPTRIFKVNSTAVTAEVVVVAATIAEAVSQTLRPEPLQTSDYSEELTMPKEVLFEASDTTFEDDKLEAFAQIEELSVTSISAEAIIDALPVELESKVVENHSDAPFERQQAVSEFDGIVQARRRYKVLEIDETGIQADMLAKAMIDGDDTIDPEFRLSDTTAMRHLTIGTVRHLALQALRGILLEGHSLLYFV